MRYPEVVVGTVEAVEDSVKVNVAYPPRASAPMLVGETATYGRSFFEMMTRAAGVGAAAVSVTVI